MSFDDALGEVDGMFRLLCSALAPWYLGAYLSGACFLVYIFREPLSRSCTAQCVNSILDSACSVFSIKPTELFLSDMDKEENLSSRQDEPFRELSQPIPLIRLIEPSVIANLPESTPTMPTWMNGFRPRDHITMTVQTPGFPGGNNSVMMSSEEHAAAKSIGNGYYGATSTKGSTSFASYARDRRSSLVIALSDDPAHPLPIPKSTRAPAVTKSSTVRSSLATYPSNFLYLHAMTPYTTTTIETPHCLNPVVTPTAHETLVAISPVSSQDEIPELVNNTAASRDSTEIESSSDDEAVTFSRFGIAHAQEHKTTGYALSYGPSAGVSSLRLSPSRFRAKASPMNAPKTIAEPARKSKEEKPTAVLKRSMWKQKSKARSEHRTLNMTPGVEAIATASTSRNSHILKSTHYLSSALEAAAVTSSSLSKSTGDAPQVVNLTRRPTSQRGVSTFLPPTSCDNATLEPKYISELHRIAMPSGPRPIEASEHVEVDVKLAWVAGALASASPISGSRVALPAKKVRFYIPASDSGYFGRATSISGTPGALAATPSQDPMARQFLPRTKPVAPVYTLSNKACTVVLKGQRIPPNTEYRVKTSLGTSLRRTGPEGLRV
ncbi:hypothetical protein BDV93DRAFT_337665 [Ceratobasidium sp. AG-I]|nr:hypothetical protein BDV93DRAFT_337665 [Ceratobasidium sp. AG-I]